MCCTMIKYHIYSPFMQYVLINHAQMQYATPFLENILHSSSTKGAFNNYLDKMRGMGRGSMYVFVHALRVSKLATQGGDQKMVKFCLHSCCCWILPNLVMGYTLYLHKHLCVYLVSAKQAGWVLKSKICGQKSTVVKWNYQILCLHPLTVCQKVPILDFQSEFSMSKIVQIFLIFFFIEE